MLVTTIPASFWTYLIAALQTVGAGGRRERVGAPRVAGPVHRGRPGAAAQRARARCRRDRAGARRLPRDRCAGDPGRHDVPAGAPAGPGAPGDRHAAPIRRCRWRACGREASWSRSAPATCASRPTRPTAYLNGRDGAGADGPATSPRSRAAPRAGSPPSSWRRSRCRAATTSPASSPASRATTATSSTTWSRRCWQRQPERCPELPAPDVDPGRLNGPLCDAVTGQDGGKATLEALDRRNLFLVPLDDRRRWYRYHHLFADVLRARLLDEQPGAASRSCTGARPSGIEQDGERSEAIRHAMAGGDLDAGRRPGRAGHPGDPPASPGGRAASVVRGAARRADPDAAGAQRRVRRVAPRAGRGRRRRGAAAGRRAVAGCPAEPSAGRVLGRPGWSSSTRRHSATCRARSPSTAPDWPGSAATWPARIAHAQRALEFVRRGRPPRARRRGGAPGPRALDERDLDAAHRWYAEAACEPASGRASLRRRRLRARHWLTSGSPRAGSRDADAHYERGLRLATPPGGPVAAGRGGHARGHERARSASATISRPPRSICVRAASWATRTACRRTPTARASRWRGSGRPKEIWTARSELLDEAERLYVGDFSPDVRPIAALRARVLDRAGEAVGGLGLGARARPVGRDDLTLRARVRARHPRQGAAGAGDARPVRRHDPRGARLPGAPAGGGRGGRQDGERHRHPDRPGARPPRAGDDRRLRLASLERAIELAEPEGYVRVFLDEGPPMAALLRLAAKQPNASGLRAPAPGRRRRGPRTGRRSASR